MSGAAQAIGVTAMATTAGFDYSALSANVSSEARAAADRIRQCMHIAIIEVGSNLARIKDQLPHGLFGKWLTAEFGFTERTAQNYMAAASLATECETVSVLRPKTLYLLAAPSTPPAIKQQVVDRLNRGEVIPDRSVKEMVAEAKFQQGQEQKRAEKASTIARLSPRARQSRADKEAERQRKQEERERERAEREAAKLRLRDLVRDQMGDRLPEFVSLLKVAEPYASELHALFHDGVP